MAKLILPNVYCYVTAAENKTTRNKLLKRTWFYWEKANYTSYNND